MLLLICGIAAIIAFPTINFNSPDGLYVTAAFWFVAVEGYRAGVGISKRERQARAESKPSRAPFE